MGDCIRKEEAQRDAELLRASDKLGALGECAPAAVNCHLHRARAALQENCDLLDGVVVQIPKLKGFALPIRKALKRRLRKETSSLRSTRLYNLRVGLACTSLLPEAPMRAPSGSLGSSG